jgi:hypothetical protein
MATVTKTDFSSILFIGKALTKGVSKSLREALWQAFNRGPIAGRLVLRKHLNNSGGGKNTTLDKQGINKRFRLIRKGGKKTPFRRMKVTMEASTWPEHAGIFATKPPKAIKPKGKKRKGWAAGKNRRYFVPQFSKMGDNAGTRKVAGKAFQMVSYTHSKAAGAKRASTKITPASSSVSSRKRSGGISKSVFMRKEKPRNPLATNYTTSGDYNSSGKNRVALQTKSMYKLMFKQSPIGGVAAHHMFNSIDKVLRQQLQFRMSKNIRGSVKRAANG